MVSGAKSGANFSLKAYCNLVKRVEVVILLLLPYSIGKVKVYEEIEEREPIDININLFAKKEEE